MRSGTVIALVGLGLLVAGEVAAQPAPSGAPDRPTATGSGSTTTGSPSMVPGGSGGNTGTEAKGATGASNQPQAPGTTGTTTTQGRPPERR